MVSFLSFSITVYYKILNRVSCSILQDLAVYLLYIVDIYLYIVDIDIYIYIPNP